MPDTRSHRGAHPEDAGLFAAAQLPTLQTAAAELCWLLDHGYALRSSLALVGNRHALTDRQRLALARCACSADAAAARGKRLLPVDGLGARELAIDGYNLLISLEAALGGGLLLLGRDGCIRDLASLHGTYRSVAETQPGIELIGTALAAVGIRRCRWVLDRPVSNSGRLQQLLLTLAAERGWSWEVELEFSPDAALSRGAAVVATSDSAILDRCAHWVNLARHIITTHVPSPWLIDLRPAS